MLFHAPLAIAVQFRGELEVVVLFGDVAILPSQKFSGKEGQEQVKSSIMKGKHQPFVQPKFKYAYKSKSCREGILL